MINKYLKFGMILFITYLILTNTSHFKHEGVDACCNDPEEAGNAGPLLYNGDGNTGCAMQSPPWNKLFGQGPNLKAVIEGPSGISKQDANGDFYYKAKNCLNMKDGNNIGCTVGLCQTCENYDKKSNGGFVLNAFEGQDKKISENIKLNNTIYNWDTGKKENSTILNNYGYCYPKTRIFSGTEFNPNIKGVSDIVKYKLKNQF